MKQFHVEQLQLSDLLERYPHYVMVVKAEDLTIQTVNPAYHKNLEPRDVIGLPISEVFVSRDVDHHIRLIKSAVREKQSFHTPPIKANIAGAGNVDGLLVHTIVPISDGTGGSIDRVFIYSENSGGGTKLIFHDCIALTYHLLERVAIQNVNLPATIFDRFHILQDTCGDRNASPASTQPAGDYFLREF